MSVSLHRPPGYVTKAEAADRLGMSTKTLERRIRTEPVLGRILRKGKQVWLRVQDVEAYFRLAQERGSL